MKWYSESFYIIIIFKKNHNNSTGPFEKSKAVSFTSSILKNVSAFFSRFPVKLICCIAFGPASSFFCLLNPLQLACNSYNLIKNQLCTHLLD